MHFSIVIYRMQNKVFCTKFFVSLGPCALFCLLAMLKMTKGHGFVIKGVTTRISSSNPKKEGGYCWLAERLRLSLITSSKNNNFVSLKRIRDLHQKRCKKGQNKMCKKKLDKSQSFVKLYSIVNSLNSG